MPVIGENDLLIVQLLHCSRFSSWKHYTQAPREFLDREFRHRRPCKKWADADYESRIAQFLADLEEIHDTWLYMEGAQNGSPREQVELIGGKWNGFLEHHDATLWKIFLHKLVGAGVISDISKYI